ncbi:hypothetical protein YC2023_039183 [Brassica napus]
MKYPDLFVTWIMRCIDTAAFSVSVNGELEGFFGSSRGIRQGCSLSPYLYVIISNVLSKLLNKAAANDLFGYHPQCQEVNLSHLSFADDIVVFTNGSPASLRHILLVFEEFASLSGLQINIAKSTVLAAGRGKQLLETEAAAVGLSVSTLPIKYLGLPLTSKIMSKTDYEPLVSKIRNRLLSWTSKALSYAGRLQLIKSVIASMTNFWCADFCLPQACIDEIESMCSVFLWSGSPHDTSKAKVALEDVCQPYAEGGLCIRRVREVSMVFMLKLIWRLFSCSTSLWGDWARHYLLRGETFWDARDTGLGSWVWRKLLQLKPLAKRFIRMTINDGRSVRVWTDIWHPEGRLIELTGEIGTQKLGIAREARVCDVFRDGAWRFRNCRDQRIRGIVQAITAFLLSLAPASSDAAIWKWGDDEYKAGFVATELGNNFVVVRKKSRGAN